MKTFYRRLAAFVGSRQFFYLILLVFVLESAWIAFSGLYPMAFDEDFHFGLIKIYAHHISPFVAKQPPNSGAFRSVVHDPSYLYHYLMSFPYRFMNAFTHSQTVKVIVLRLIDIAMMAGGLVVFRKLLSKTKAHPAYINLALLFFVLTPVVPELAGQINYDDLVIPLTGLALLLAVKIVEGLKSKSGVSLNLLAGLIVLCLLASLVKYSFLPIFLVVFLYLAYQTLQARRRQPVKLGQLLKQTWQSVNLWKRAVWVLLLIVSLVMFGQRYGVNIVRYHSIVPACDKVLSVQQCSQNGPWARNFNLIKTKSHVDANPLRFTLSWIYGLFERSFFAVNGPASGFATQQFFPILGVMAAAVGIFGVLLFIYYRKLIFGETKFLGFLLFAAVIYSIALWFDNYTGFLTTGQMVAINGRYLFPVILPVYLSIALGYKHFLADRIKLKVILPLAVFLIFLTQGGGALTFILRSNANWYWPHNRIVDDANQWVGDIFNHTIMH